MLELRQVSFSYTDKPFLEELSMGFQEGKITGILGANGSGKSTVMKLLTQLLLPQQGSVYLDCKQVNTSKKRLYHYRQEVNMVFQNPEQQLFYTLVEEDVALALTHFGYSPQEIDTRVTQALEMMDISYLRQHPLQYLSYGQKKRVAIAGVLALKPRYLLLDEPTAGLDPRGKEQMATIMTRLVTSGTSIIISSHDMDLMYNCCDYSYVLNQGKMVAEGDKYHLFQQEKKLRKAGLGIPWIVKLHEALNTPLAKNDSDFFEQLKKWRQ